MVVKGIIKPPPDIRAVVDRTAKFVSKNGRAFEQRIMNSEKGKTPKFAFLQDSSPFHAYYEARISFYDEGGDDEEKKAVSESQNEEEKKEEAPVSKDHKSGTVAVEEKAGVISTSIRKASIDPIAKAMVAARTYIEEQVKVWEDSQKAEQVAREKAAREKGEETPPPPPPSLANVRQPPKLHFIHMCPPHSISPLELDTIRLTAQFTAISKYIPGTDMTLNPFLETLRLREWNNVDVFGFLQPRHAHYAYFTALVDCYRSLLRMYAKPPPSSDTSHLDEMEMEILQCASTKAGGILPCLDVVAYRAEYKRYQYEQHRAQAADDDDGRLRGGSAYVDWHDFVVVETIDFPLDEVVSAVPPPPPATLAAAAAAAAALFKKKQALKQPVEEITMDMSDEEDDHHHDDEEIKIVDSYQPRVKATAAQQQSAQAQTMIDPITGKAIPVSDLSEHMRIQLLDPKWAEEKKRFMEKQRDSNLLQGEDVARNLQRFAKQQRGDANELMDGLVAREESQSSKRVRLEEPTDVPDTSYTLQPPPPPPLVSLVPVAQPPMVMHVPAMSIPAVPIPSSLLVGVPPPVPIEVAIAAFGTSSVEAENTEDAATLGPTPVRPATPPASVTLIIRAPEFDLSEQFKQWGLHGQSMTLENLSSDSTTVKFVKEQVRMQLTQNQMPLNKMQLRLVSTGAFLKDAQKLAEIEGISVVEELELVPKVRGGRK